MSTKVTTPKTQKPKNNNFVLILERFLEKYNLSAESNPEQLVEHNKELGAPLQDWMTLKIS